MHAEIIVGNEIECDCRTVISSDDLLKAVQRASMDPKRRRSKALRDLADIELLRGDKGDPDEGW